MYLIVCTERNFINIKLLKILVPSYRETSFYFIQKGRVPLRQPTNV